MLKISQNQNRLKSLVKGSNAYIFLYSINKLYKNFKYIYTSWLSSITQEVWWPFDYKKNNLNCFLITSFWQDMNFLCKRREMRNSKKLVHFHENSLLRVSWTYYQHLHGKQPSLASVCLNCSIIIFIHFPRVEMLDIKAYMGHE